MKLLIVLCLGVLAIQAAPQLKDPIDDLVRELEELNRVATTERTHAIDELDKELRSLDEGNQQLLHGLGEDLQRDAGILEEEVHELERRAREYRVDISECIGDQLEEINKLPEGLLGEAGLCISRGHAQAEQAVNDASQQINRAIGNIDEYWRRVERCQEAQRDEQELCLAELNTEIKNAQIEIPSQIRLALTEALGHVEAEKPSLLLCIAGKTERLNEEGRHIIERITECAERLFPPHPKVIVASSPQLQDPIDDLVRELQELNIIATTERTHAIDELSKELRSLDEGNQELLHRLGEDLVRDAGILEEEVHELERRAREYRVDISECIGDQLEEINKLPEGLLGEAGLCLNRGHAQAEQAVNDAAQQFDRAIGPIDEYWRRVERCQEAHRDEQELCLAELNTEIKNAQIEIPSQIRLALTEAIGHVEAEKPSLLLCVAGKTERLNEEGRHIIQRITECAERLFPPHPKVIVASSPQLQDPIDDLVRELQELNIIATTERTHAIDELSKELRSLDEGNQELLHRLGEDLVRDAGILEEEVHELERRAREYRVDISECIGDQLEEINKLPEGLVGEAGLCLNRGHAQAEQAVNDAAQQFDRAIGPIDEYWRRVERCQEAHRDEQELCLAELNTEIKNAQIEIPSQIRLALTEAIGHVEAEKPSLLLCVAGKTERLNEEGRHIIERITECAERLFPPHPPTH